MSAAPLGGPVPSFRSALRARDFRMLLAAHGAGTIAQLVTTLAVGIEVLARTTSGVWVSVTIALGFAPYVIFSGYAGLVADRYSRSLVLTWSFVGRAGCAALLAVALLGHWPVPILVLTAAVAAVLATPAYPALAAATPECVATEQLPPANALVTGVENVTWIAGPGVLGLLLLSGSGPGVATAVAAGLFVLAAAVTVTVRLPRPPAVPGTAAALLDGLRVVAFVAAVRRPMTVAVIDNFLYGYLVVAMVLLGERLLGGTNTVGLLNAALSVGALASMAVVNRMAAHTRPGPALAAVMIVFAVSTGLAGLVGWLPLTIALIAVAGGTTLIAEVMAVTLLQRAAPDALVARVFGVYDQLNVGAIAVGSLIAGPLADALGADAAIAVVAACCLLASVAATSRLSRSEASLPAG
jgi:MFS family permease